MAQWERKWRERERERKGGYFGERCTGVFFFFFPFTLPCNGTLAKFTIRPWLALLLRLHHLRPPWIPPRRRRRLFLRPSWLLLRPWPGGILCFLLHGGFTFGEDLEGRDASFSLGGISGDDDRVKDGAGLDLPHIDTDGAKVSVVVDGGVLDVLRVGNLWVNPLALVFWVVDSLGRPVASVFWVVNGWGLPLAVHLFVPVFWLFGLWVNNLLLGDPVVWLGVFWIVNLGFVHPVVWLGHFWVLDLLRLQEVKVFVEGAGFGLFAVNGNFVSVVRGEGELVQVRVDVVLGGDRLLVLDVLAVVVHDDVDLSCAWAANIRSKHQVVRFHVGGGEVGLGWEDLHVATTAVNVLFVLDTELFEHSDRKGMGKGKGERGKEKGKGGRGGRGLLHVSALQGNKKKMAKEGEKKKDIESTQGKQEHIGWVR